MAKLKITKLQYDRIILNEHKSRLNDAITTLNENTYSDKELVIEGWRDVVLGVGSLLGLNLSGHNKIIADKVLSNEKTMSKVKTALEDENKVGELINKLKEKGMRDPEHSLLKKATKIITTFNDIAERNNFKIKLDSKAFNNLTGVEPQVDTEN